MHDICKFFRDDLLLFWVCEDGTIWRCNPKVKMTHILKVCHMSQIRGHYGGTQMAHKIL